MTHDKDPDWQTQTPAEILLLSPLKSNRQPKFVANFVKECTSKLCRLNQLVNLLIYFSRCSTIKGLC